MISSYAPLLLCPLEYSIFPNSTDNSMVDVAMYGMAKQISIGNIHLNPLRSHCMPCSFLSCISFVSFPTLASHSFDPLPVDVHPVITLHAFSTQQIGIAPHIEYAFWPNVCCAIALYTMYHPDHSESLHHLTNVPIIQANPSSNVYYILLSM
eukprot:698715_1